MIITHPTPVDEKPDGKQLGAHREQLNISRGTSTYPTKMARGIKTINAINQKFIREKLLRLALNALILRHLHYSAVVMHAIEKNL